MPATVSNPQTGFKFKIKILLDSGFVGNELSVINPSLVNRLNLEIQPIKKVHLTLGDNITKLKIAGKATLKLELGPHVEHITTLVTDIDEYLVLGMKWLTRHNPRIDWVQRTLTFEDVCVHNHHIIQHATIGGKDADFLGFQSFPSKNSKKDAEVDGSEEDLSSGQDEKFLSSSEPKEFPPTKGFAELKSGAIDGKFIPSGTNRISLFNFCS